MPRVSIVMAAYNHAPFIAAAIESVLAQTFHEFELIVVDDGSTDNTTEAVRPYLTDSRVVYFRKENGGQASAKNYGIARAAGQFIAFLDADDLWCPDKLDRQLPLFADSRVGVVHSWRRVIDPEGRPRPYTQRKLPQGSVLNAMFIDNFVCFSSSVVRAECFHKLGVFDQGLRLGIDYDLWIRFASEYAFDHVESPLVSYRTGHAQLSKSREERILTAFFIMDRALKTPCIQSRLSPEAIREAFAMTHNSLANVQLELGRFSDSRVEAKKSIKIKPMQIMAYKTLVKSYAPASLLRAWRIVRSVACGGSAA